MVRLVISLILEKKQIPGIPGARGGKMVGPSQTAVDEIERFIVMVTAGLDLYNTSDACMQYAFGNREFIDVVKRACEDEEMNSQLSDLICNGIQSLNSEISQYIDKMTPNGLPSKLFDELQLRLEIFYEMEKAIWHYEQLNTEELSKYIDYTKEAVDKAYNSSKDFAAWKKVKPSVLSYFTNQSTPSSDDEEIYEPNTFARPDGVITSLSYTKAQSDGDKKRKLFVAKMEKVLKNFLGKNPDLKTMRDLIKMNTNFEIDGMEADKIIENFLDVWDLVFGIGTLPESHILFTELLKKFFLIIPAQKQNIFAEKTFLKFHIRDYTLPNMEKFIENYQVGLTEAINCLPNDHQTIHVHPEKFEKVKINLLWYLFATPATALYQMFLVCVSNKGLVPGVLKVCREIPALFRFKVKSSASDSLEYVLVTTFKRLFAIGREWPAEKWDNAVYLALSCTKTKKSKNDSSEDLTDEVPLLDSFQLILISLTEIVKKNPIHETEAFLKILSRLIANNANNKSTMTFSFTNKFSKDGGKGDGDVILAPELLKLMYDMLLAYDKERCDVADYCREIMKSLGARLQEENVVFDYNAIGVFGELWFNNASWWVKYAIYSWFSTSFNHIKRQIPSGLYISLPEIEKDNFEQIKTSDQASAAECYLRSFFELALFDADLAVDLLSRGHERTLQDVDVIDKMALSLVDSYGEKLAKKKGGYDVPKLLKRMLEVLNPTRTFNQLRHYSNYIYEAINNSSYLLVLSKAVKIALEKDMSYSRSRTENQFDKLLTSSEIASQLLEVYCETAKKHVEQQVEELTALQKKTNDVVFGSKDMEKGWKLKNEQEGREQTLLLELEMIFTYSVGITRMMSQIPIKLQMMLLSLVKNVPKLHKSATNRTLDDELTETAINEVVYAYAESLPPTAPEKKDPPQITAQPFNPPEFSTVFSESSVVRPAATVAPVQHQSHSQYSVENTLFDGGRNGNGNNHYKQDLEKNYSYNSAGHSEDENNRYRRNYQGGSGSQYHHNGPARYSSQSSTTGSTSGRGGRGGIMPYNNNSRKPINDPHNLKPSDRQIFNSNSNSNNYYEKRGSDHQRRDYHRDRDSDYSRDTRDSDSDYSRDKRRTQSERDEYSNYKEDVHQSYDYYSNRNYPASGSLSSTNRRDLPIRSRQSSFNDTSKLITNSDTRNRVHEQFSSNNRPNEHHRGGGYAPRGNRSGYSRGRGGLPKDNS